MALSGKGSGNLLEDGELSTSVEFDVGLPASSGSGPIGSMQVVGLVPRRHVALPVSVLVKLKVLVIVTIRTWVVVHL